MLPSLNVFVQLACGVYSILSTFDPQARVMGHGAGHGQGAVTGRTARLGRTFLPPRRLRPTANVWPAPAACLRPAAT